MEASHQLLAIESLHSADKIQDGGNDICSGFHLERCLRGISRLEGYILLDVDPSGVENVPLLCPQGGGLQFKAMCFSLSTAAWVFTKVFKLLLSWARTRSIHCIWFQSKVIMSLPILPCV